MKLVPKIFVLLTLATFIFINSAPAFSQAFVPPPDRRSGDPLIKVYSELKVGMTLSEVRDIAEKYYPNCKLEDTDIWGRFNSKLPYFSWVLGAGQKRLANVNSKSGEGVAKTARIFLRVDFDSNSKLINAVYVRDSKKGFKQYKSVLEERRALVGDGYYK